MKNLDSRAKKEVIEELLKMVNDSEMNDMKSVQVSAKDDESLLKGLDKAKEVLKNPEMMNEEEDESEDDKVRRLEEELKRLRSKRS